MGTPKQRCAGCHEPLSTNPRKRKYHRIAQHETIPYCAACYHAPYELTCRNCGENLQLKHRCPRCQAPRLRRKMTIKRKKRRAKSKPPVRPALSRT